jgi:hypothetical protein
MRLPLSRLVVSSGRIIFALGSLTLVVSLNGCWAVAGPLIGVGVVGGGAGAVAMSRRSGKAPPDPVTAPEGSSGIAESESVPPSDNSELTDHHSPAIAALQAPSPDTAPSPIEAVSGTHHKTRAHHRKRKAIARASKPKHHQGPSPSAVASSQKPLKSQSSSVATSPLTAPPDALPYTQIVH